MWDKIDWGRTHTMTLLTNDEAKRHSLCLFRRLNKFIHFILLFFLCTIKIGWANFIYTKLKFYLTRLDSFPLTFSELKLNSFHFFLSFHSPSSIPQHSQYSNNSNPEPFCCEWRRLKNLETDNKYKTKKQMCK